MPIVHPDPASAAVQRLIALSDTYMAALYPAESDHLENVTAWKQPNVHFVGVEVDGELAACGAVKTMDDVDVYGEIKRVFVLETHRGRGLSRQVMQQLEDHLCRSGVALARLEASIHQPEALGLYRALGYATRGPSVPTAPTG